MLACLALYFCTLPLTTDCVVSVCFKIGNHDKLACTTSMRSTIVCDVLRHIAKQAAFPVLVLLKSGMGIVSCAALTLQAGDSEFGSGDSTPCQTCSPFAQTLAKATPGEGQAAMLKDMYAFLDPSEPALLFCERCWQRRRCSS